MVYKCYSKECINKDPYELGTWQTQAALFHGRDGGEDWQLNANLVKMLLEAKESKKDALVITYLNR